MKKLIIAYLALGLVLLSGCNDEFLDRQPLDMISSEAVYSDKAFVEAYLFKAYNYMPCGYGNRNLADPSLEKTPGVNGKGYGNAYILDCLTDLLTNKSPWPNSNATLIPGQIFANANDLNIWDHCYDAIRFSNNMLYNLESSPLDEAFKTQIAAEARFLRAYQYFDLARRYGGVPIIDELQTLENLDEVMVSRNTEAEVYEFINLELSEIADLLPSAAELGAENLGRATREACWALNGRSLLYAKRYAESAASSKKVIDANYYELSPDYNLLFQSYGGDKEVIFESLFNGAEKGHGMDILAYPFGHRTDWGSQMLPTLELVNSYEMSNGLPITDPASGYDPNNPFANRDSRLTATVLYHGSSFKGKTFLCALSTDPTVLPHDVNAPQAANNVNGNLSTTGFYLNKFLDQTIPDGPGWGVSKTSWKEIRLGEVLLNYAEAQNEASGPDETVYAAINKVRARAGQPALPAGLTKDLMFERIVQERKVELIGEGHRYWDLRRWRMAVEILDGTKAHGLYIYKDATNPENLTYEVVEAINRPTYVFHERFYYMPIPLDEMDKNPNLVQNEGY